MGKGRVKVECRVANRSSMVDADTVVGGRSNWLPADPGWPRTKRVDIDSRPETTHGAPRVRQLSACLWVAPHRRMNNIISDDKRSQAAANTQNTLETWRRWAGWGVHASTTTMPLCWQNERINRITGARVCVAGSHALQCVASRHALNRSSSSAPRTIVLP